MEPGEPLGSGREKPKQHPELWVDMLPIDTTGERSQVMGCGAKGETCDGRECWGECRYE